LRLLGIRVECLVLVINEALVCTWGNCGIYGRQLNVCMSWSVVETMISGGALWAIMTAKVTHWNY
jgi:hypothetical protein